MMPETLHWSTVTPLLQSGLRMLMNEPLFDVFSADTYTFHLSFSVMIPAWLFQVSVGVSIPFTTNAELASINYTCLKSNAVKKRKTTFSMGTLLILALLRKMVR